MKVIFYVMFVIVADTHYKFTCESLLKYAVYSSLQFLVHSTGQNLLPRRKGHKRTSMSHSKVPHLTHPPFTYERQPQHRDHPTLI